MKNITKEFPGVKALDNVNLQVEPGEIHALIGENGAGKSTLMNVLSGTYPAGSYTGEIYYEGKLCQFKTQKDSEALGIVIIHQELALIPLLSIGETIRFNTTLARLDKVCSGGIIDRDKEVKVAEDIKNEMGTKTPTIEQHIGNLSGGNQQKALLGKWMFTEPDVLILDEPTRGIDVGAKYDIYCLINDMVSRGKSVVMISSELPELLGMCDRIYVMNEGRLLAEVNAADATQESIMCYIIRDTVRGTAKA